MSFETYTPLYESYPDGRTLRPGGAAMSLDFDCTAVPDRRYRLFVVGETAMFYQWKDEPDYPLQYRTISDALDTKNARDARFCLNLSSKKSEKYIRRVYKKVLWKPVLSYLAMHPVPEAWTCGVWARAEKLRFEDGGYLRMRVDIYHLHEGISRHSVALPPDENHILDFSEGTWDWTEFLRELTISPDRTAHVGVWFEGMGYQGNFYLENAFLTAESGENLLPAFDIPVPDEGKFDWTGQNISRKEWPEFEVTLNGEVIFRDEVFERSHLDSEWEIALPAHLLNGKNHLEIRLISDYHDPLPYKVHEIGRIEQPGGKVALIACSPAGSVAEGAYVLLRTESENAVVRFASGDGRLIGKDEYTFAEPGLHGIRLQCPEPCGAAPFTLTCDGTTVCGEIPRIAERMSDRVVTGTGDLIYVEQRTEFVEEYLSWYLSNGIGNLVTIRPTYRWSGTRVLNPAVWAMFTRVLNELGIAYVLMIDGRELPGMNANPDEEMMAGAGYYGSQLHEHDGMMAYWGLLTAPSMVEEQYNDMLQRIAAEDREHANPNHFPEKFHYLGDTTYRYRNPQTPRDTKQAMLETVEGLRCVRTRATRHTGPSVLFKYLFDAGYTWVGAETMYGSMEPLMAFLRGACRSRKVSDLGVHHAVQWSSSPQDAPEHFRRFRLALYVSYMQGATEINTEEGLWHLEEYYSHFHRFSEGCGGHLRQQRDFFRYVSTHSRTGRFYTPVALLHGRYDGWHGFGNHHPWGWMEQENSDAENSWDLMKVFYPLAKPGDALYIHGCGTDHPVGYHSGAPMGNVDVLPAEGTADLFAEYRALAFMGYHCAEAADIPGLTDYVRSGGTLLLTRAHLSDTTEFASVKAGNLHELEGHPFGFCDGIPEYAVGHVDGREVRVCTNIRPSETVSVRTDEGYPLVCIRQIGEGTVTLVNALAYPAHPAIRKVYEQHLEDRMREEIRKEPVWTETGDDMGSAVYVQEDGSRHIYLTAVDWYRPEELLRTAYVRVGNHRYAVRLPFGVMTKCVVNGSCAAWCHSEDGEVIAVGEGSIRVQGAGTVTFTVARDGIRRDIRVDFTDAAVQTIATD